MSAPVCVTEVTPAAPDLREIRRYCGCPEGFDGLISECIAELQPLPCRVCWLELPVRETPAGLDLGFAVTPSRDLRRALEGCGRILLFAATAGLLPDRLMARYSRVSPTKALFVQGIAAERVEALCSAFCELQSQKYAAEGARLLPRFSPGYGDVPLEMQKAVISALDCTRLLGITLNKSLLMTPSKSVTAIAGIRNL